MNCYNKKLEMFYALLILRKYYTHTLINNEVYKTADLKFCERENKYEVSSSVIIVIKPILLFLIS